MRHREPRPKRAPRRDEPPDPERSIDGHSMVELFTTVEEILMLRPSLPRPRLTTSGADAMVRWTLVQSAGARYLAPAVV